MRPIKTDLGVIASRNAFCNGAIVGHNALYDVRLVYPAFHQHIVSENFLGHLHVASVSLLAERLLSPYLVASKHIHHETRA